MGRLTATISGKFLAFDTAPLIYYIEQFPQYSPITDELFDAIHRGDARGMTSVLTLLEVLVQPLRSARIDLADLRDSPIAFRRRLIFTEAEPLRRARFPKDDGS